MKKAQITKFQLKLQFKSVGLLHTLFYSLTCNKKIIARIVLIVIIRQSEVLFLFFY